MKVSLKLCVQCFLVPGNVYTFHPKAFGSLFDRVDPRSLGKRHGSGIRQRTAIPQLHRFRDCQRRQGDDGQLCTVVVASTSAVVGIADLELHVA